jgi:hypothetical protein
MKDETRDHLIDALRERGVTYLAGGHGTPSEMSDEGLIYSLIQLARSKAVNQILKSNIRNGYGVLL